MKFQYGLVLVLACCLFVAEVRGDVGEFGGRDWPCTGDLDFDYDIDLSDLSQLLSNYGMTSGAEYEDGDISGDGDVDLSDLSALLSVYGTTCPIFPEIVELAGNELRDYPFFQYVRAFNENAKVLAAIDPTRYPGILNQTCDLYVVEARTQAEWEVDPVLFDVRDDGPQGNYV